MGNETLPAFLNPPVTEALEQPAWERSAHEDFIHLRQLRENWDSYGAPPIVPQTVMAAASLLRQLTEAGTPRPTIVPTPDGSVQLEWHTRGIELEVRWLTSTRMHVYFEDLRGIAAPIDEELEYDVTPLGRAIRELSTRVA